MTNETAALAAIEIADRIENGPGLHKGYYYPTDRYSRSSGHIDTVYRQGKLPMCAAGYIMGATSQDVTDRAILFTELQAVIGNKWSITTWNDLETSSHEVALTFKKVAENLRT